MIDYDINKGKMKGQAILMLVGAIISETEEKYECETAIISSDEGVTTLTVLHALARLVANTIKNISESEQEFGEMLGYIVNTTMDMLLNDTLN